MPWSYGEIWFRDAQAKLCKFKAFGEFVNLFYFCRLNKLGMRSFRYVSNIILLGRVVELKTKQLKIIGLYSKCIINIKLYDYI